MTNLPIPLDIIHENSFCGQMLSSVADGYMLLRHPLLQCWAVYDKRHLALVPAQSSQRQAHDQERNRRLDGMRAASIRSALTLTGITDEELRTPRIKGQHMEVNDTGWVFDIDWNDD